MQALADEAFVAAIADPGVRFETERFGRTRPGSDWSLERRRVAEHYLGLYLDGRVDIAAGGEARSLGAGGVHLVAPGVAHDIVPVGGRFTFFHWRFRLWRGRRELRLARDAVLRDALPRGRVLAEAAWEEQLTTLPLGALRQRALLAHGRRGRGALGRKPVLAGETRAAPRGAVRLTARFVSTDPISDEEFTYLTAYIRGRMEPPVEDLKRHLQPGEQLRLVGTSGTIECMAALIANDRLGFVPEPLNGFQMSLRELQSWVEKLRGLNNEERLA